MKFMARLVLVIFVIWAICLVLLGMQEVSAKAIYLQETNLKQAIYVRELYQVEENDTLNSIVLMYMKKNTYGEREVNEFTYGIIELNSWLLDRDLKTGDILDIRYWKKYPDIVF